MLLRKRIFGIEKSEILSEKQIELAITMHEEARISIGGQDQVSQPTLKLEDLYRVFQGHDIGQQRVLSPTFVGETNYLAHGPHILRKYSRSKINMRPSELIEIIISIQNNQWNMKFPGI